MTSVIDGYVANALAGPNLQPFWAAAYAGFIGRVRAVHDFLGEPPPTIERIAALAARDAELAALLDRLTPLRSPSGQPLLREDLEQWYRTAWLRLDPALRARIAAGVRRAADAVAAVRVCSAPSLQAAAGGGPGVVPIPCESVYFGTWNGVGPAGRVSSSSLPWLPVCAPASMPPVFFRRPLRWSALFLVRSRLHPRRPVLRSAIAALRSLAMLP